MVPVAKKLQEAGNNVFVGAGEKHLALFRSELSNIKLLDFPGFRPSYSKALPQYLAMLLRTPLLLYHIIREHHRVKRIIDDYEIDVIISDNRFGLWNRKVISVYVTHILRIPLPLLFRPLERAGVLLHAAVIKQYDHCFIPDLPGETNLSGRLSHNLKIPLNARYIGILSRFIDTEESPEPVPSFQYDSIILSGPEPQRSILKSKVEKALGQTGTSAIFLEGKPEEKSNVRRQGKFIYYPHVRTAMMKKIMKNSRRIISRSGYTTIMDLVATGCTGLLIPTPGQTEQEYLADYLSEKGLFSTEKQNDLQLNYFPSGTKHMTVKILEESRILLDEALSELLKEENK